MFTMQFYNWCSVCTLIYRKEQRDEREMTEQIKRPKRGTVFGSLFGKFMCANRCRRRDPTRRKKNLARYTFPVLLQRRLTIGEHDGYREWVK